MESLSTNPISKNVRKQQCTKQAFPTKDFERWSNPSRKSWSAVQLALMAAPLKNGGNSRH